MAEPATTKRTQYFTHTHTVTGARAMAGLLGRRWPNPKHSRIVGFDDEVTCVAVEGSVLLTGSKDKKARVWDLDTMTLTGALAGHDYHVRRVLFGANTYITACRYGSGPPGAACSFFPNGFFSRFFGQQHRARVGPGNARVHGHAQDQARH